MVALVLGLTGFACTANRSTTAISTDDGTTTVVTESRDESGWVEPIFPPYFEGPLPLVVRMIVPENKTYAVGVFEPYTEIIIKNISEDHAVALRNVSWSYRPGLGDWNRHLYGSSSLEQDGSLRYNGMNQQLTQHEFEEGLLLPGESMQVTLPVTPQIFGMEDLVVSYLPLGGEKSDWHDELLIPSGELNGMEEVFTRPTPETMAGRSGGSMGILTRSLYGDRTVNLPSYTVRYPIEFPNCAGALRDADESTPHPCEMEPYDAARRAGIDLERESYWCFWREELQTWFFVRDDRSIRVLQYTGNVRVFEDGLSSWSNEGWEYDMLGTMAISGPEQFATEPDGKTKMILDPRQFGDIVDVKTPWTRMYYNPGITTVTPDELWQILKLARENHIDIKLTAINPNGLGVQYVLVAGVEINGAGRWLNPEVEDLVLPME